VEEAKNSDQIYHLHAILIHSGSLDQGHYYCYIRPSEADVWFKFNDNTVTPAMKHVAFATGQGGYLSYNIMKDQ
jgi:ubiquitin carboxyl-terminal hydrolase 7